MLLLEGKVLEVIVDCAGWRSWGDVGMGEEGEERRDWRDVGKGSLYCGAAGVVYSCLWPIFLFLICEACRARTGPLFLLLSSSLFRFLGSF